MTKKITFFIVLLVTICTSLWAQDDYAYLKGMPDAKSAASIVETNLINGDIITLYAKRASCLDVLYDFIKIMGNSRTLNGAEWKLQESYYNMAEELRKKYENSLTTNEQKERFNKMYNEFKRDSKMEDFAFSTLVSPETKKLIQAKIDWILNEDIVQPQREKRNNLLISLALAIGGILSVVWAFKIKFKANKYEFNNRTAGGVVEFSSHAESISHKSMQGIANLLYGVGAILLFVALFYYFATKH